MREKEFRERLEKRNLTPTEIESSVSCIKELEEWLLEKGVTPENSPPSEILKYINIMIENKSNSLDNLLAQARYFYLIENNEVYIHYTRILGGLGVLENIKKRVGEFAGNELAEEIFKDINEPELGSSPDKYPASTIEIVKRMEKCLSPEVCRRSLAGNNHGIPLSSMEGKKKLYKESKTLDDFLKAVHKEALEELEKYEAEGKIWFEQKITPQVVDFVRKNQELLSGVRDGNIVYMTKIPYNPEQFFAENDTLMKRYYTCHCPLAREAILQKGVQVPKTWCYCSGGFEKFFLEAVLNQELEVEVLESVLAGDDRCRFAIKLPEKY